MQAYVIEERGESAVFVRRELPEVAPELGEVKIEIHATSLNPIDHKFLVADHWLAPPLPAVLHGDVAGIVVAIGPGVKKFRVGDEVYGCVGGFVGLGGALAKSIVADEQLVAKKPPSLSFEEAAALPLVAITAFESLLDRAKIKEGDKVLIHAGTGGVGHLAVQLAKATGAFVATTVSTEEKGTLVKRLGADEVIFYKQEPTESYVRRITEGLGFDVVFDTVGGENLQHSFAACRPSGQVVNISAKQIADLTEGFKKGLTLHFENMSIPLVSGERREHQGKILTEVTRLVEEGKILPLIHHRKFLFSEALEAHRVFAVNEHLGKIVLKSDLL